MKRFILFTFVLFTMTCVYSQGHLEFRDIPIDGTLKSFVKKLKKQGYKQILNKGTYIILEGRFAVGDAQISVYSTEKTKTVWKVSAIFGIYESWNEIKGLYSKLKDLYIAKYGNPNNTYEFLVPSYIGKELEAIKNEKGACASFFDVPNGTISIVVDSMGAIVVSYEDTFNSELFSSEKLDVI